MQTLTSTQTGKPTATFGNSVYGANTGNTKQLGYTQAGSQPRPQMAPRGPMPLTPGGSSSTGPKLLPDQMPLLGQPQQQQQQQGQQGHNENFRTGARTARPAQDVPGGVAEAAPEAGAAEAGGAELGLAALAL